MLVFIVKKRRMKNSWNAQNKFKVVRKGKGTDFQLNVIIC